MEPESEREYDRELRAEVISCKRHTDIAQLKMDFANYLIRLKTESDVYDDMIGAAAAEIAKFIDWLENGDNA